MLSIAFRLDRERRFARRQRAGKVAPSGGARTQSEVLLDGVQQFMGDQKERKGGPAWHHQPGITRPLVSTAPSLSERQGLPISAPPHNNY